MSDRNIMDHPPSPEELAEIYRQSEENDPRSLFYKRTLHRPKFPVVRWLLLLCALAAVTVAAYAGLQHAFGNPFVSVPGALVALLFTGFLLGKPLLITMVETYQAVAPAKTRERCRYEPSCSVYMLQALKKYGFLPGLKKGLKRWRSCKPPNGGIDPP